MKTSMSKVLTLGAVLIGTSLSLIGSGAAFANSGHGPALEKARINLDDKASLQRGAKLFVNYCMGCHSAQYMRYNRMAKDLGIEEAQLTDNLIFTDQKVGDKMTIAMPPHKAKAWFGKTPPDLTVISRARGTDWLYSYLKGFYLDPNREVGTNNLYFKDVGMPHVLAGLEGAKKAVFKVEEHHGKEVHVFDHFEKVSEGSMTEREYDRAVNDLVNYLAYQGEPAQLMRAHYGPYVIAFLIFFTILAYLLKKEYWKDVH